RILAREGPDLPCALLDGRGSARRRICPRGRPCRGDRRARPGHCDRAGGARADHSPRDQGSAAPHPRPPRRARRRRPDRPDLYERGLPRGRAGLRREAEATLDRQVAPLEAAGARAERRALAWCAAGAVLVILWLARPVATGLVLGALMGFTLQ